ncbi:unnamed protein product [Sphacelaria rigidula]
MRPIFSSRIALQVLILLPSEQWTVTAFNFGGGGRAVARVRIPVTHSHTPTVEIITTTAWWSSWRIPKGSSGSIKLLPSLTCFNGMEAQQQPQQGPPLNTRYSRRYSTTLGSASGSSSLADESMEQYPQASQGWLGGSPSAVSPSPPPPLSAVEASLQKWCDRGTSAFPAWVLGAAMLGLWQPGTMTWFGGDLITAALVTTMVSKLDEA